MHHLYPIAASRSISTLITLPSSACDSQVISCPPTEQLCTWICIGSPCKNSGCWYTRPVTTVLFTTACMGRKLSPGMIRALETVPVPIGMGVSLPLMGIERARMMSPSSSVVTVGLGIDTFARRSGEGAVALGEMWTFETLTAARPLKPGECQRENITRRGPTYPSSWRSCHSALLSLGDRQL